MRSSWAVYQKLREVKYRHLVYLYKKHLRRLPDNCLYNRKYTIESSEGKLYEIRLCMLHQKNPDNGVIVDLVTICQEHRDCQKCNAFVMKYTKEDIKKFLDEELSDPKIKEKKYPDICALDWVLERNEKTIPYPRWIKVIYYFIKNLFKKAI